MKIRRRTFLKASGSLLTALLLKPDRSYAVGKQTPRALFGHEVRGRCPLCSVGCGVIYRSTGFDGLVVEGDPECPTAMGSLCVLGSSLLYMNEVPSVKEPLYRAPGSREWERIGWEKAVDVVARRLKDLRDRDLSLNLSDSEPTPNRVSGLGVLTGGGLTNEEAYAMVKLFRCLGVFRMDTMVRANHGMGVLGLMDTIGLPGGTHPPNQIAYSDVVLLMGCNPGQTAPALSRFLDRVRQRRGSVIVIDTRKTETVKRGDLFLQVRPGTDAAVLGAFLKWILERGEMNVADLIEYSDAPLIVLSQVRGEYERHRSGKNKNRLVVDETLTEPYSVFQRLMAHFERYSLRKISGITGLDIDLLREACTLLGRTVNPHFSASIVLGSGTLGHHSGLQTVRMAAMIQALLGNLDKKGGGIVLSTDAGNAQGVCDMGLLSPFFPGYLDLTEEGQESMEDTERDAFEALCRTWYPGVDFKEAIALLPHRPAAERTSVSTIIQGINDGNIKALIAVGDDPVTNVPGNASLPQALSSLDLLIVLDHSPGRTGEFWKSGTMREETIKTEVLFIPTETPAFKDGSMTDSGRRALTVRPVPGRKDARSGLLDFMVDLGNSIISKYSAEGGLLEEAVLEMNWPMFQNSENIAVEINGWRKDTADREELIPRGGAWKKGDRCGNRLYRGWMTTEKWFADRREPADPRNAAMFENWGWFWPGGIPDPFSWIRKRSAGKGVYLRWDGQAGDQYSAEDVVLSQARPPLRFWMTVDTGTPFPEHYEPFYSPLHDMLTGGSSSPHLRLRSGENNDWDYLFRKTEELLRDFPVIITIHETGNIAGNGGITAMVPHLRELGTHRIVEISPGFADLSGIRTGDTVLISSPFWEEGISAEALITGRITCFTRGHEHYHVVSVTRYGEGDVGINVLTTPAFDAYSGGLETRTFMGKIKKVER